MLKRVKQLYLRVLTMLALLSFAICAVTFAIGGTVEAYGNNLVPNGGFEKWSGYLSNRTPTGWTVNASVERSSDRAVGKYSAKTVSGTTVFVSSEFAATTGTKYLISYYYKSDSSSGKVVPAIRSKDAGGQDVYDWHFEASMAGVSGWKGVSFIYVASKSALRIQLEVTDAVWIDEVSVAEITSADTEINTGFESVSGNLPSGWVFSDTNGVGVSGDVYYQGTKSLKISRADYLTDLTLSSIGVSPVDKGVIYDIGFRIKSRNSKNVYAFLKIDQLQSDGNVRVSYKSPRVYLNAGSEYSEWTDVWMRGISFLETVSIKYSLTISKGVSDLYLDDVFCVDRNVNVFSQNFDSVTNEGVCDGVSGPPSYFGNGKLVLPAGGRAETEFNTALYGYKYAFGCEYAVSGGGTAQVELEWYNYSGNKILTETLASASGGTSFSRNFSAPAATCAKLVFKNTGSGSVSFDNVTIDLTEKRNPSGTGSFDYDIPAKTTLIESKVEKTGNGGVRLVIDDKVTVPMMYLRDEPFKTEYASGMSDAGIELICLSNARSYAMNGAGSMWTAENTYDFTALDGLVRQTLKGAPEAKLMLMLDADPPAWWLEAHPESCSRDENGNSTGVSYASTTWRTAVGNYFNALLDHVLSQPYAGYVFAVKLGAGRTYEWQYYGQTDSSFADFGTEAISAFRAWLAAKYGTDANLRNAWGNSSVTLNTANVPSAKERARTDYGTVLNGKTQRNVIDFHLFLSDATTDSILFYSKLVKEKVGGKWIVGTYNGYQTVALNYEGTSITNASVSRLLSSPYIDFLCAPISYSERLMGMSASYMTMADSIIAAGKLPIVECDNRTVYFENWSNPSLLAEWGKTYTLKDTLEMMKRDFASVMLKGAGLWWYDMEGGWFNDPEIYSLISAMKTEWEFALKRNVAGNSRLAFVIEDDLITNVNSDFGGVYNYLYQSLFMQKESLAHIGESYDLLYLSDLKDGASGNYDVYLILALNLDAEERAAINAHVKRNGKTIIWSGAPLSFGSDGKVSVSEITAMTGITLAETTEDVYAVQISGTSAAYTQGIAGEVYGEPSATNVGPVFYVKDSGATSLGVLYGSTRTGLAIKTVSSTDGGTYTSIYSAVGNVPAGFLRNILAGNAVTVEFDNDVVYSNNGYVSINSPYGGEKTLSFSAATNVFDVFANEWVATDATTFTVTLKAGESRLFRLRRDPVEEPGYAPDLKTYYGVSLRSNKPYGLRWAAGIGKSDYDELKKLYGEENVSFGIMVAPYDYVVGAGEFTVERFESKGPSYKLIDSRGGFNESLTARKNADGDDSYCWYGSLVNIDPQNLDREFAGRAYIIVKDGSNEKIYYSAFEKDSHVRTCYYICSKALSSENEDDDAKAFAKSIIDKIVKVKVNSGIVSLESAGGYTPPYTVEYNGTDGKITIRATGTETPLSTVVSVCVNGVKMRFSITEDAIVVSTGTAGDKYAVDDFEEK